MENNNGNNTAKSRIRLNIIDIMIIVMAVACIAAIAVRFYFTSHADLRSESVTVRFSIDGISDINAAEYKSGQKIYLASNDTEIGYFDTVNVDYMMIDAKDESGDTVRVTHPDKKTVTGTVVLMGKWTENGFAVNGTDVIRLGSQLSMYSDRTVFTLTIDAIPENPSKQTAENDR